MKKIVLFMVLVISMLSFSGSFSLSVLNLTTIGMDDGSLDYFPIVYVTYRPFDFLSLKVSDYLLLSHDTWTFGSFSIFKPRYYYLESKFKISNFDITLDVLKARLKKTQTEKLDGLRVGGLKFDYFGAGAFVRFGKFDLGVAYDTSNLFAGYAQADLLGFKIGGYFETKYQQISMDLNKSFGFKNININTWAALSAKTSDIANFSYLVGAKLQYKNISFSTQYLKLGSNPYDADYQEGDPNSVAFTPDAWAFYADLDYNFNNYILGVFLRHNSEWSTAGYLPLYGAKLTFSDFTLKIGNGDLESNIAGEQKIAVELNYFYSLDFDKLFGMKRVSISEKTGPEIKSETSSYNSIMDVILGNEGETYIVKGVVTAPKDLLGKGSFYIQDEVAGLMIYAPALTDMVNVGDVVIVTGTSKLWNGIIEIVASNVEKVGEAVPKADVLTSLSKSFLSSLVYVEGVVKEKNKYDFMVDTGEFIIKVYIKKGTNIDISNIKVGTAVKVTGILSIYKGEYEILPRWQNDVEVK
ncbi:MAG: DNA-binding protein [Thermosipho sp. (in: Bacteria)]|nr:DNA-binding protein [Thermosipho sp. (in: thermotogales)]